MAIAAINMPDVKKAQFGRLTFIEGEFVGIYGLPRVFARGCGYAGYRTRAIVPEWAAIVSVTYVWPTIATETVVAVMQTAGRTVGIGTYRRETGAAWFGDFQIVGVEDDRFRRITRTEGRAAQRHMLDHPICYDEFTADLLRQHPRSRQGGTDERSEATV